jgi:endonuclease YncB( thermonuclease family)
VSSIEAKMIRRFLIAVVCAVGAAIVPLPAGADIVSYAIVHDDASLEVRGRTIYLYGIDIPRGVRACRTSIRPARCAPEAALALDFRIQSFVRCEVVSRYRDRSVNARCFVKSTGSVLEPDEDLSAYLLERGLALALPGAPFEYQALERIARAQGRGLWSSSLRRVR